MRSLLCISLLVLATLTSPVQGGLFNDIYRGLGILATPSGSPLFNSGDGTRVNGVRNGRLRILPDAAGRGYSLEFDRTFGNDSRGRPEVLDLGAYELQLEGSTQATLAYTRRGGLVGNADVRATDLNYALRAKSGAQDIALSGTLNVQSSLEINALGFYTLNADVSNANSALSMDGVIVEAFSEPTNFDIGPISLRGNIFVDGLTVLLSQAGVDTTPLEQLFPGSPASTIIDALERQLENAKVHALQAAGDGQLPPIPAGLAPALTAGDSAARLAPSGEDSGGQGLVPEPGTLLLICLGGLILRRRR